MTEAVRSAGLIRYANPTRFMELSGRLLPWLAASAAVAIVYGSYLALYVAPADYQMGETVRIMFVHVPAAWFALIVYVVMAGCSLGTLVWRHPLADVSAKAAAPIGAGFTLLCLIAGAIWGKPTWGTWWEWDARLTSVLILFLIYLGIIALWQTIEDPIRAGKATAILTLVGLVNIPIIRFSVDWWRTLHQPASVVRIDGPTIHPTLLVPLLVMAVAFALVFVTLHLVAMRAEILRRRVRTLRSLIASAPPLAREEA